MTVNARSHNWSVGIDFGVHNPEWDMCISYPHGSGVITEDGVE